MVAKLQPKPRAVTRGGDPRRRPAAAALRRRPQHRAFVIGPTHMKCHLGGRGAAAWLPAASA